MSITIISPREAQEKLKLGAQLIDIRQADEFRREHISGAFNCTVVELSQAIPSTLQQQSCLIFHCTSGQRTKEASPLLAKLATSKEVYILDGGIQGWKNASLETIIDKKQPLPLMQQVQIAAGSLALVGTLAGWLISPTFYILPGFVGAGLILAGITGFCRMARLLAIMPWNKSRE